MKKETIGTRIGRLRGRSSQADVAAALGVSRETVKFWESGERHIKEADIVNLAQYFRCSADYLLGLSDDTSRTPSAVDELHLSEAAVARIKEQAANDDLSALFSRLAASVEFWGILNDVLQARQYAAAPDEKIAEMARTKAETDFRKKAGVSGALLYGERYKDFLRLQLADVILREVE